MGNSIYRSNNSAKTLVRFSVDHSSGNKELDTVSASVVTDALLEVRVEAEIEAEIEVDCSKVLEREVLLEPLGTVEFKLKVAFWEAG